MGVTLTARARAAARRAAAVAAGGDDVELALQRADAEYAAALAAIPGGALDHDPAHAAAAVEAARRVTRGLAAHLRAAAEGRAAAVAAEAAATVASLLDVDPELLEPAAAWGAAAESRRRLLDPEGGAIPRFGVVAVESLAEAALGRVGAASWGDARAAILAASPFTAGRVGNLARRLAASEALAAFNRGGFEAVRAADDRLGDVVKVLCATFDERTGWDSYQVHGQVRRPDEAFEWNGRFYQHPPNRPNDREVVLPFRASKPLPRLLRPRSDAEVARRWRQESRRGAPPARPEQSTVPVTYL